MQEIMLIIMAVMTAANIVIMLYIAQCLGKITALRDEVYDVRTDIREKHTDIKEKYLEILHASRKVLGYREDMCNLHQKIKERDEATQKTSSCQYNYEYTNSTV